MGKRLHHLLLDHQTVIRRGSLRWRVHHCLLLVYPGQQKLGEVGFARELYLVHLRRVLQMDLLRLEQLRMD
jgi:hypothetical protein